jgi:F-type H+-transporting ATPase subunit delta
MASTRVASRYIKSLLGLAVDRGVLEEVHDDMQLFSRTCEGNRDLTNLLRSPIIKHDKKKDILERIFKGKVHSLTIAFIDIITRKNREPLLPLIAKEFHNAYNEHKGIGKATVTTTIPMDEQLRSEVEAIVKKLHDKKKIELVERVDKDLIGGFILNVEDKQIDASIKNKLKSLKVTLSHNPYIKEF